MRVIAGRRDNTSNFTTHNVSVDDAKKRRSSVAVDLEAPTDEWMIPSVAEED